MAKVRLKASVGELAPEEAGLDGLPELVAADSTAGMLIWKALVEGAERADLIDLLVRNVEDLQPDRAADDVDAVLSQLRDLDLLEDA